MQKFKSGAIELVTKVKIKNIIYFNYLKIEESYNEFEMRYVASAKLLKTFSF